MNLASKNDYKCFLNIINIGKNEIKFILAFMPKCVIHVPSKNIYHFYRDKSINLTKIKFLIINNIIVKFTEFYLIYQRFKLKSVILYYCIFIVYIFKLKLFI